MKLYTIASIIGLFGVSSIADAQSFRTTQWEFTESIESTGSAKTEDYSTNLQQEVAATMPHELLNQGWACTRKPVVYDQPKLMASGNFTCTNGVDTRIAEAKCSLTQNDRSHAWLAFTLDKLDKDGVQEDLKFEVSCRSVR